MKIEKYKKLRNGKYELTLEDKTSIQLYEDTILKYELLLRKNIDNNLKGILEFDKKCEVYYIGLKYLKVKARSKKEVFDYLIKKEYTKNDIEQSVNKLVKQGYVNDLFYAKGFLNNKLITTSNGPYKIKTELLKKGISIDIIEKVLEEYDVDTQLEKIKKIATRIVKTNRNKSNKILKMKIMTDLTTQGFSKKNIEQVMSNIEFPEDKKIAINEREKLYKKLSRKYSGEELEFKIRQKMYQKGFDYK